MRHGLLMGAIALGLSSTAFAGQHFMQIEQVIVNAGGDSTAQAIQLRMRQANQNFITNTKLIAYDAAGLNPVELINFPATVANGSGGDRILAASSNFMAQMAVTPDATLAFTIPVSYLAAGRIVFERSNGTELWSLCWGGASYTGPTTASTTNDADGEFGPCFSTALPQMGDQGVFFDGAFGDLSTNNAADYAVTAGAAVVENNAGTSSTVPVELETFAVE